MTQTTPALTKKTEALIQALRTRHGRKGAEYCVCDGLRSSSEVVALAPDLVVSILLREGTELPYQAPVPPIVLSARDFERVAPTVNSQGIIVVSKRPAFVPVSEPLKDSWVLVLDRVGDPGNFGTIVRTARAAGIHEVWLTKGTVDPFSDKAVRSASGAQFAVQLRRSGDLSALAEELRVRHGVKAFYRTLPASGNNLFTEPGLFDKTAIILGCESTGVAELEDSKGLNIPMPGDAESLNVAQAATIILFEYVRRQFC